MPASTPSEIRNIALAGHSNAGKTTLVELMLHTAGAIGRVGTVEEGSTVSDFEEEEKHHKHSLYSAKVHFEHEGRHFNVFDTPGFPDFLGQTLSVLPAVETVAVVVGADKGIQTTTRRIMQVAKDRNLPRMIIINKVDEHVGELEELLGHVKETFGAECLPVNLPTPDGSDVVDLWEKSDGAVAFGSAAHASCGRSLSTALAIVWKIASGSEGFFPAAFDAADSPPPLPPSSFPPPHPASPTQAQTARPTTTQFRIRIERDLRFAIE